MSDLEERLMRLAQWVDDPDDRRVLTSAAGIVRTIADEFERLRKALAEIDEDALIAQFKAAQATESPTITFTDGETEWRNP